MNSTRLTHIVGALSLLCEQARDNEQPATAHMLNSFISELTAHSNALRESELTALIIENNATRRSS